jgi:hypothetical protein
MSKATKSDATGSIRCLINLHKMPITRFEMLADRNGFKRARARRQVLEIIASKANPDGTGSYVSDTFLAEKTGFTEKYLWTLRQELKTLSLLVWIDKRGFGAAQKSTWGSNDYTVSTTEAWPRRHGIKKLNPVLSDAEGQDSEELNPVLSEPNPVIPEQETALNPVVSELNPVLISTDNRPSLPPFESTVPSTAPIGQAGGSGALAKDSGQGKDNLDVSVMWVLKFFKSLGQVPDKQKVITLFEGRNEDAVRATCEHWRRERNLEGVNYPFSIFMKEFEVYYDPKCESSEHLEQRMKADSAREQEQAEKDRAARVLLVAAQAQSGWKEDTAEI